MNTVITLYDRPDKWFQNTYICCECSAEFMVDFEVSPKYCPYCGVKFDALRIKYSDRGKRMETIFINDEKEEKDANS